MPATRWGLTVPFTGVPLADHPELYRRAEALGYDDLWSGETPNGADGFTTLSMAIPVTERMRLATGIVNPFTRGPAVLAQTAATLQEASGGRFVLGLGASSNIIVERFNGLEFRRPLSKVREAVERLRPVLSVPAEKGYGGLRLERPVSTPVPIVLAALRERMLGLAGELADGAFTNFLPLSGLPQVRAAHRAGEAAAGRPEGSTELVCRFFIIPGDASDPSGPAAIARGMFSAYGSVPVYAAFFRWLGWAERLDPMVAAYEAGDRAHAMELAPEELIREIFLFGAVEEIRERLQAFVEGGISTAVLTPICSPQALGEVMEALAP
ncbi:MAG TPA: LLM class flavin-dependent oxidoreductase [Solirubrobacteraceae bacterium]|nr:LLM class flavin-dependent oxidoreductase [Solirubrobacteraceae bacterium]